jgi:hypothetical protein
VGKGGCWDLVDRALRQSGARGSATTGADDDYVWGDPVELKDVVPGDILQFRDFTVTTKTEIDVTFDDGFGFADTQEKEAHRGHHSAIVESVPGSGALIVLEQHVKPLGKRVQKHRLPTQSSNPTSTTVYKQMKTESGKMKPAKVIETVTITVTGTIWAYRPKLN